jgi:selenocysteine-specific elongation factor
MDTLGGGIIVNALAKKHRRFRPEIVQSLAAIENNAVGEALVSTLEMKQPLELRQLAVQCNISYEDAQKLVADLASQGKIISIPQNENIIVYTQSGWDKFVSRAETLVKEYHQKFSTRQGMPKSELSSKLGVQPHSPVIARLFATGIFAEDGASVRLASYQVKLNQVQQGKIDAFLKALHQNPYSPPTDMELEPDLLNLLMEQQKIVKVGDGVIFPRAGYDEMVAKVLAHAREHGSITLAAVRDIFGTSRKYAKALLEYMDEKKLTRRIGDERVAK